MTAQNVTKYAVATIADVLSQFGIPTTALTQIYQDVLKQRNSEALEILLSEIRQGNFNRVDQQDLISIMARYQRDAMEGVAKVNLRLLARMIKGMAEKGELKAPSFLRHANSLSSLTEKEIRILSVMVRFKDYQPENKDSAANVFDKRHEALLAVSQQAEGHMQALMRTGLVNMVTDKIDYNLPTTNNYRITKLMEEVLSYIPNLTQTDNVNSVTVI
jgi:hypothetical protein